MLTRQKIIDWVVNAVRGMFAGQRPAAPIALAKPYAIANPYLNGRTGRFPVAAREDDIDRLRREVGEPPREKTPKEYSAETVRREEGL